jgi:hypothetical protein
MTNTTLVLESIRSFITRSEMRFNRRTLKIAGENLVYSNDKIKEIEGIQFKTIEESLSSALEIYHRMINKNP